MYDCYPCLLTRWNFWVSNRGRTLRLAEKCRLQGMDPSQIRVVVSDAVFTRQLGNSMSVNVVERILCQALGLAGV